MALAAAMLTPACGNNAGKETKAEVQESAAVQANVTHLTKADFLAKVYNYEKNPKEWKYEGGKPAIVDFYATWCGPCKAIAPVLEKLAAEYKGKIVVYKIDTDKVACSSSSRIKHPAPSPITKPSRLALNGREARTGSSLRVDSACMALKPPTPAGKIAASAPPVTMMLAFPKRI